LVALVGQFAAIMAWSNCVGSAWLVHVASTALMVAMRESPVGMITAIVDPLQGMLILYHSLDAAFKVAGCACWRHAACKRAPANTPLGLSPACRMQTYRSAAA
jgi:hypothetical protein